MNNRRSYALFAFALIFFMALAAIPARAAMKILSVPGFPFFLSMETGYGDEVRELVLRTPGETRTLEAFTGLTYVGEDTLLSYTDRDWRNDLLWRIRFREPARGDATPMGKDLWIGALTGAGQLWVGFTDSGPSLWDRVLPRVKAPAGTAFLISPRLPIPTPDATCHPENDLAFIYTIRLTGEGPRFVIVPQVYEQLARLTDRFRRLEEDRVLRSFYDGLFEDFTAMSRGELPSVVALARFPWKNMGYDNTRP